ncbi:hypothetical protein [Luteolibacter luteus]|uniref:Uncharacterized protein n=1 Tax=Luteolibacter luteus TaxID=2728835 RepID=A0A858RDY4_9BACT|nr:hypothetical protein [Luteolibacter luteus]QJE94925.1 hypothetical protein HHL09_03740 [Luteolibacter luteus]
MKFRFFLRISVLLFQLLPALATDLFFPDQKAVSENGLYRIEARSPENRNARKRVAFARSFAYQLIETKSGKTLWNFQAGPHDPSCSGLHVDNDGWTVIEDAWGGLSFFSPKGEKTGRLDIIEKGMTARERRDRIQHSTAGPMWEGFSLWYFLKIDGRRLFVIRPWWGRQIIADVTEGSWIDAGKPVKEVCIAYERQWTTEALFQSVETLDKWNNGCCAPEAHVATKAAFLAGKLGMVDAIPMLRKLQDSVYVGNSSSGTSNYEPAVGGIDPANWTQFTMRQVVHQSLRRLGEAPLPYPCIQFGVKAAEGRTKRKLPPADSKQPRDENVASVQKGMKPEEVVRLIGAPDFKEQDEWAYDIDRPKPFRLTLTWDKEGVTSIKRGIPGWKTEDWDRILAY